MKEQFVPDQQFLRNAFLQAVDDGNYIPEYSPAEAAIQDAIVGIPFQGVNFLETSVLRKDGSSKVVDVLGYDPFRLGQNVAEDPTEPGKVVVWTGGGQPIQRSKEDYKVNVTPPKK